MRVNSFTEGNLTISNLIVVRKKPYKIFSEIYWLYHLQIMVQVLIWRNSSCKKMLELVFLELKCFNSRDDNFSSKWAIFQKQFSQPMVYSTFCNSYGGLKRSCIGPHKSLKIRGQPESEKGVSKIDPYR